MKKVILLILFLLAIYTVSAEICDKYIASGEECYLDGIYISSCDTYDIYNETWDLIINDETFIEITNDTYTAVFNQTSYGEYFIVACDNSIYSMAVLDEDSLFMRIYEDETGVYVHLNNELVFD